MTHDEERALIEGIIGRLGFAAAKKIATNQVDLARGEPEAESSEYALVDLDDKEVLAVGFSLLRNTRVGHSMFGTYLPPERVVPSLRDGVNAALLCFEEIDRRHQPGDVLR